VEKTSTSAEYETFLEDLPEDKPKWAVYDFEFESGEGKRNKLIFFNWCAPDLLAFLLFSVLMRVLDGRVPEICKPLKLKMLAASSKDALRKALVGINIEIQGNDESDVSYETGQPRS
jgi:cofilin